MSGAEEKTGDGRIPIRPLGEDSLFLEPQILRLFEAEFSRARRYGHPLSCVLVSIDRLQKKADLFGVKFKSELLDQVAFAIRGMTRLSDFVGFYEAETILVLLPHTGIEGARALCERVRKEIEDRTFYFQEKPVQVTVSIGLSSTEDKELLFHDTLLKKAEAALSTAREMGGNRVEVK